MLCRECWQDTGIGNSCGDVSSSIRDWWLLNRISELHIKLTLGFGRYLLNLIVSMTLVKLLMYSPVFLCVILAGNAGVCVSFLINMHNKNTEMWNSSLVENLERVQLFNSTYWNWIYSTTSVSFSRPCAYNIVRRTTSMSIN